MLDQKIVNAHGLNRKHSTSSHVSHFLQPPRAPPEIISKQQLSPTYERSLNWNAQFEFLLGMYPSVGKNIFRT